MLPAILRHFDYPRSNYCDTGRTDSLPRWSCSRHCSQFADMAPYFGGRMQELIGISFHGCSPSRLEHRSRFSSTSSLANYTPSHSGHIKVIAFKVGWANPLCSIYRISGIALLVARADYAQ